MLWIKSNVFIIRPFVIQIA